MIFLQLFFVGFLIIRMGNQWGYPEFLYEKLF
jgi:hypothetical protein